MTRKPPSWALGVKWETVQRIKFPLLPQASSAKLAHWCGLSLSLPQEYYLHDGLLWLNFLSVSYLLVAHYDTNGCMVQSYFCDNHMDNATYHWYQLILWYHLTAIANLICSDYGKGANMSYCLTMTRNWKTNSLVVEGGNVTYWFDRKTDEKFLLASRNLMR